MKPVPHGEPYAGKLHVRFDEGAGVPHGASRSTLHPLSLFFFPFYGELYHIPSQGCGNIAARSFVQP